MNGFSEAVLFAVVLAANLFLLGAVLAGGLTLTFRFTENFAPRLRYSIAVAVFLLAVLLPVAATLKTSSVPKTLPNAISEKTTQSNASGDFAEQNDAFLSRDVAVLKEATEVKPAGFIDGFISIAADSAFGQFFVGLWMAGICLLILREAIGVRRIQNAGKSWQPATETEKQSLLRQNNTPLYFAENQSPGTIGWLRPAIVLPAHFSQTFSLDARRLIVRHELSHALWRDPLAGFLVRIIRAVFWVSPALWLLERLIESEREAAADRSAILSSRHSNAELKTTALDYADALLLAAKEFNSFELRRLNRKLPLNGIGGAGTSELEIRIRRLLSSAQASRLHTASAIVAVILTAVVVSVMPRAVFSDKLLTQQNQTAALKLPGEEDINRESPANQTNKTAQKSVGGDEISFKQSIPVVNNLSKTEKTGKTPIAAENLSDVVPQIADSSILNKTSSDENIRNTNDRSNQNQPPAISRKEAETVTINGSPGDNPARTTTLTGNLEVLNKLQTDSTGELNRLSKSSITLDSARKLSENSSRTRTLTTAASPIQ